MAINMDSAANGTGLPRLELDAWRPTRDALHGYARVVGGVRAVLAPREKHWRHITLHATVNGLATPPIAVGPRTMSITLDLLQHVVLVATSDGRSLAVPLVGQSQQAFAGELVALLGRCGVEVELAADAASGFDAVEYDRAAARRFWQALSQVDAVFRRFKATLREESGPVHVFPHHFDLSLKWFTGRLVPGHDPDDEESADEHMNFGFVTGDALIPEAYFYATAYPLPDGFTAARLPHGGYWTTQGFTGAILDYAQLMGRQHPREALYEFLAAAKQAGATHMR